MSRDREVSVCSAIRLEGTMRSPWGLYHSSRTGSPIARSKVREKTDKTHWLRWVNFTISPAKAGWKIHFFYLYVYIVCSWKLPLKRGIFTKRLLTIKCLGTFSASIATKFTLADFQQLYALLEIGLAILADNSPVSGSLVKIDMSDIHLARRQSAGKMLSLQEVRMDNVLR